MGLEIKKIRIRLSSRYRWGKIERKNRTKLGGDGKIKG